MNGLAIAILVGMGLLLLPPGTVYKVRPSLHDYAWDRPHVYISLALTVCALLLAILTLAS